MNLFVAKLDSSITGDDLNELFSAFGEVTSAKVIFDRETGNSKCFGFVEMLNSEEANAAIAELNGSELQGKQLVVKEANPQQERPRRDNRGGGGGYNRGGGDRRGGGNSYNRGGDRRRNNDGYNNDRNDRW